MGFKQTEGRGFPMLRSHYEKILFPFDVFRSGAMTGEVMVSTCLSFAIPGRSELNASLTIFIFSIINI